MSYVQEKLAPKLFNGKQTMLSICKGWEEIKLHRNRNSVYSEYLKKKYCYVSDSNFPKSNPHFIV